METQNNNCPLRCLLELVSRVMCDQSRKGLSRCLLDSDYRAAAEFAPWWNVMIEKDVASDE